MLTRQFLELENKMLKQLLKYGKIYVNTWSSDCDGGHSVGSREFTSIDEFYQSYESAAEWCDGSFGMDVVEPNEMCESETWFTR